MHVVIGHPRGSYAHAWGGDVYCNGRRVAILGRHKEVLLTLTAKDIPAKLEVRTLSIKSNTFEVTQFGPGMHLECGAWNKTFLETMADIFAHSGWPRSLYLRKVTLS